MTAGRVYRLTSHADWRTAKAAGPGAELPRNADDARDGYFHLSGRDQVAETARRYYGGVADLWVLEIDAAALGEGLKWEPSRGGILFPHVYGSAPVSAVVSARPFDPDEFA